VSAGRYFTEGVKWWAGRGLARAGRTAWRWTGGRRRQWVFASDHHALGGLEVHMVELARAARARGLPVSLLAETAGPGVPDEIRVVGRLSAPHLCDLGLIRSQPRLVVGFMSWAFRASAERLRVPFVQYLLSTLAWTDPAEVSRLRERLEACASVWVVSDAVREYVAHHFGVSRDRQHVLPTAIGAPPIEDPDAARRRGRDELGLGEEDVLLLFTGRWHPVKSLTNLVEAVAMLPPDPRIVLALVGAEGEPEYARRLHERIEQRGCRDRVRLIAWTPNVADWYAAADVFVLPSKLEGASLSAVEALAAGTPCVLTRVGDADELAEQTGAVVRLEPPQGSALDIGPSNYTDCLYGDHPAFSKRLAEAIQDAVDRLPSLREAARASAEALRAARSPEQLALRLSELVEQNALST